MSTQITITGNLTAEPDLRFTPTSGKAVANLTVAVNSRRRDGDQWVDGDPTFYPVTVWGEQAEHVAESLHRGSRVVVAGRIGARSWTPTEGERAGQTLTRLEVVADVVAPSLQWATARVTKVERTRTVADAPDAEEPPV